MSIGIADLHFDRCPSTSCTVCHGSQLQTCQFRTEFNLMKVNLINGCRWHMALRDGWRVASYFFGRGCPTQPSLWILHIVCYLTGPVPWLLCPVELRFFRQRFIWLLGSSSWAVELVGTLMAFLMTAIYLIAGTCASFPQRFIWLLELVTTPLERRIDVSNCTARCHWCQKRCVIFGTLRVVTEHVCISKSFGSETFWWTDGLKLECHGKSLKEIVWREHTFA